MALADAEKIKFVAIVGESELEDGSIMLKNMVSGTQEKMTVSDVISIFK